MDLKDKLIREVASELGLTEAVCATIVQHQFNAVRLFIHANPIGEIHLPRIGSLVATQKNYDRFTKAMSDKRQLELSQ